MLNVIGLEKQYEGEPLLRGVSFDIAANETVCLLGQSGGGKSTILRIIAGLETAESGEINWDGQSVLPVPAHLRHFGLMFQDYALFPHLNVFENVAFGLRVIGMERDAVAARVSEVLKIVGMDGFRDRSVIDLSGGEKQRVAFARAIAPWPKMLMLDEPMGALDRTLRDQLLNDLRELLSVTDIPVIYVTHDLEEAFAIADRVLILHQGRIVQAGNPEAVFSRPASIWVASFFGLSNQLAGVVGSLDPLSIETAIGVLHPGCGRGGLLPGMPVELLIRDAFIDQGFPAGLNIFAARVIAVRFLGRDYQITLRIADIFDLIIASAKALQVGERVQVSIAPESILCYREGQLHENC